MKGNTGKGVFYAYLAYARAVSEGNEENKEQILEILRNNCPERNHDDSLGLFQDVESIFEEEVIDRLERYIDSERIIPQYKAGGFRIDFVVKDLAGKPRLAIECDGAKYHSSEEAYCWDICRQKQLEEHGFIFHRIWSTEWFTNEERELEKLIDFVRENENPNN
jgi:very-short-patch-repair endonuclease